MKIKRLYNFFETACLLGFFGLHVLNPISYVSKGYTQKLEVGLGMKVL